MPHGHNRYTATTESPRGLTYLQLLVLDEAFTTSISWMKLARKHNLSRQELWHWRDSDAWKAEWKRREDLVVEAQDRNIKRSVEVASRVLIDLAEGRGAIPRLDKQNNVMPGPPQPVPYAVSLRAAEILATIGARPGGRTTAEDGAIAELSVWMRSQDEADKG